MLRAGVLIALTACGFHPSAAIDGTSAGSDSTPMASCSDGIKDGDETNVDCGGSCTACAVCTDHLLPPMVNVDPRPFASMFLSAPTWECTAAGTTTIDTRDHTVGSDTCQLGNASLSINVPQLDASGSPVFVVRLQGLTLTNGHVLKITGDVPLVILVAGDVTVDTGAMIDASASGPTPGPGGSPASCVDKASGRGELASSTFGWGGGGGGFGTAGGQGCYDVINGGLAVGSEMLTPLRGGCPGMVAVNNGTAGGGGGAIEISASGTITIGDASIVASGGGGRDAKGGGNGGGAGGGILLVAPTHMFGSSAALRAHGGAGTEGDSNMGNSNDDGADGHADDNVQATDSSGTSGSGGNDHGRAGGLAYIVGTGALVTMPGNTTTSQTGGRGGGGGGGGRIVVTAGQPLASCD